METNMRLCLISLLAFFILRGIEAKNEAHMHSNAALSFFTPEDLKLGKRMPDQPFITNPKNLPKFLPKELAEQIPLSLSKLPFLAKSFGVAQSSSEYAAMKESLPRCESTPMEGETRFCVATLEALLDTIDKAFESPPAGFQALTTKQLINPTSGVEMNNYYAIVEEPRPVPTPKAVSCHSMPYAYALYFCHYVHKPETSIKVFQVLLKGENGGLVEAVSVCHLDTSLWDANHYSFTVYGIKRGSPACHFFISEDLVWVPSSDTTPVA